MASRGGPGFHGSDGRGCGHSCLGAGRIRLSHRVADVGGNRLARAVESALLYPSPQFGDRGLAGVESDGGGLRDRVGLHLPDPRSAAQHPLHDRFFARPVQAAHLQHRRGNLSGVDAASGRPRALARLMSHARPLTIAAGPSHENRLA